MKKLLLASALVLSLGACVSNTATNGITQYQDKLTGETVKTTGPNCLSGDNDESFCVSTTIYESKDLGIITFTYLADEWIFMDHARARIVETGQIITLFDLGPWDASRTIGSSGKIFETWSYTFKLSEQKNLQGGVPEFVRAGQKYPDSDVIIRVSGRNGVTDFE